MVTCPRARVCVCVSVFAYFQGFRPQWYISIMAHCRECTILVGIPRFIVAFSTRTSATTTKTTSPSRSSSRCCLLFVGCLTSKQHASVSQGRICSDNSTCYHTEIEAADQTFHLTQSQYTDTGPTSPNADPITPGAWQGSHWSANV